jgi:PAS domain S-box-containing protein
MAASGRICMIESDTSRVAKLRAMMEEEGYSVILAPTDSNAVVFIEENLPDLILLGTGLQGVSTESLLDMLKQNIHTTDIPVLFITSRKKSESQTAIIRSGDDLIIEPFETREVLARIERQVTVSKVRIALRESEAKFQSVMESAIDAIISADAKGRIKSWNRAAAAMFGYHESEALDQPIEIIIPDRFRKDHARGIKRVSSGGESHVIGKTVELAAVHREGREFPVELSLATWFLDEKRYFTGIIRNIEERKQAEQKFRSVTESAIDAIISANNKGEIISWNKAATRILGFSEEEAVGQCLELIIPERFHEDHRNGMARFNKTGDAHVIGKTVELAARTKSGEELPIELSLSTWLVREERYYTGIIRDIGERKQAEEALRKSEHALRKKSEEMRKKNAELETTLQKLNNMHSQLIIQEKMASLGKLSAGMAHELNNPAAAAQRSATHLQEVLQKLQKMQIRLGRIDFDEEQIKMIAELGEEAKERASNPVKLTALSRSEKEENLEEWLALLGEHDAADIVPPLVSAGFDQQYLQDLGKIFPAQQLPAVIGWLSCKLTMYELVCEIGLATGRISKLVKALKSYTYMDQAPVQSVDVRKELDNTLIILNNKLKNGIDVVREYDENLPVIEAFASELNQVWTNLIDNAIDAMNGKGRLIIRAGCEGAWVVVEIEDNGPGIAAEHQAKIYDPFFTTKAPGKGTGLGLNISRNLIVQKHRGEMQLETRPGSTCFTIKLPVDLKPDDATSDESRGEHEKTHNFSRR